ncbi:hypothetical protein QQP08_009787 [Theobroma cacao]|nr:hypothetical protein QQP08_009787 [Theobroma cacao]
MAVGYLCSASTNLKKYATSFLTRAKVSARKPWRPEVLGFLSSWSCSFLLKAPLKGNAWEEKLAKLTLYDKTFLGLAILLQQVPRHVCQHWNYQNIPFRLFKKDLQECEALIFFLILCLWVILLFSSLDAKDNGIRMSSMQNNGSELNVERERER